MISNRPDTQSDDPFVLSFEEFKETCGITPKFHMWNGYQVTAFANTDMRFGFYPISDLIVIYGDDHYPVSVTERVYAKNYPTEQYKKILNQTLLRVNHVVSEYNMVLTVTVEHEFFDISHTREVALKSWEALQCRENVHVEQKD